MSIFNIMGLYTLKDIEKRRLMGKKRSLEQYRDIVKRVFRAYREAEHGMIKKIDILTERNKLLEDMLISRNKVLELEQYIIKNGLELPQ